MKEHTNKCASNGGTGGCDCDGYHTFDELYDHRFALFIALCKSLLEHSEDLYVDGQVTPYRNGGIWRSKLHHDGSSFDGWFIMGIRTDHSKQITYHLPLSKWDETGFAYTLEVAPEWDGHTSDDVIERLKNL
jgi:hypothetical protein